MSGIKRKIKRKKEKKAKKELDEKIFLFSKMGDECLVCKKPFDKKNKDQVKNWNVVVRQKEKKVNLYCPTCWQQAREIIQEFNRRSGDN